MKNKKKTILWGILLALVAGCFYGSHLESNKKRPKGFFEIFTYPYRITKWLKHNEPVEIPELPSDSASYFYGSRIQRTMSLLESSNTETHNKVKILFYGQSIVMAMNSDNIIAKLKSKYPDAIIEFENRGIGGFEASSLVRTAVHDLYPYYPDLLIFHVYGGEKTGELERIIYNTKKYTTSEIMIFNHHLAWNPDSVKQAEQTLQHDNSSKIINLLAQKYGCELVDIRSDWKQYIETHPEIGANVLVGNRKQADVHPNKEGNKLLELLLMRHFQFNSLAIENSNHGWYNQFRTYDVRRFIEEADDEIVLNGSCQNKNSYVLLDSARLNLTFQGNKVELNTGIDRNQDFGQLQVFIDGKKPSEIDDLYSCTLPSKCLETWFPSIKRIALGKNQSAEQWVLTITKINHKSKYLEFELIGSVTGYDGKGDNKSKFVSNSGRIIIEPEDFFIFNSDSYKKVQTPVGYKITWEVQAMFSDTLFFQDNVEQYLIAQGLENTEHKLVLVQDGAGGEGFPVKSLEVFRPDLRD